MSWPSHAQMRGGFASYEKKTGIFAEKARKPRRQRRGRWKQRQEKGNGGPVSVHGEVIAIRRDAHRE